MSKLKATYRKFFNMITFIKNYYNNKLNNYNNNNNSNGNNLIRLQFITAIFNIIKNQLNTEKNYEENSINNKIINKYWSNKSINNIINEADKLYENENYLKVYKLLNHMKYLNNIEIKWRLCRALYKLSHEKHINEQIRYEIINEAHDIIMSAFPEGSNSSIIHKWAALTIDRKTGMESLQARVKHSKIVKNHLIKSCELNPNDITIQYLLGRWCYEMTHITWFQRILSKLLYYEPPKSSYEEANKYLTKVDDLQPRLYLQNTYFLGKTCLKLGQYYRAKYYLNIVANSNLKNSSSIIDRKYILDSQRLIKKLSKYNLTNNLLLYEYLFGVNE